MGQLLAPLGGAQTISSCARGLSKADMFAVAEKSLQHLGGGGGGTDVAMLSVLETLSRGLHAVCKQTRLTHGGAVPLQRQPWPGQLPAEG